MIYKLLTDAEGLSLIINHYSHLSIYMILGSSSVYVPSEKTKYLDKAVARQWPNLEGEMEWMTPGEAARVELRRAFPDLKRVGWPGKLVSLLDWRPPLMYGGPAISHNLTYVDLTSAYATIYGRLWLDVAYPRALYGHYPLDRVASKLELWKGARNSLMGLVRSRSATAVKSGQRISVTTQNPFLSPCLWASVQSLLHMVATYAIDHNALYINTDGYIFKSDDADRFMMWLGNNDFRYHIRAMGAGEIRGWNKYQVGNFQTKLYELDAKVQEGAFSNVHQNDAEAWLQYWGRLTNIVRSGAAAR